MVEVNKFSTVKGNAAFFCSHLLTRGGCHNDLGITVFWGAPGKSLVFWVSPSNMATLFLILTFGQYSGFYFFTINNQTFLVPFTLQLSLSFLTFYGGVRVNHRGSVYTDFPSEP